MVDTGEATVSVASGAGVVGLVDTCSYSTAKGGVISLTRQIAVDYASEDIRVNAVSPGFTDTPLFREDTHDGTRQYAERDAHPDRGRAVSSGRNISPAAQFRV
jgi:NAD(P)-dependent dehydrogenase (short-subunit alcohol dehydrogenase family)